MVILDHQQALSHSRARIEIGRKSICKQQHFSWYNRISEGIMRTYCNPESHILDFVLESSWHIPIMMLGFLSDSVRKKIKNIFNLVISLKATNKRGGGGGLHVIDIKIRTTSFTQFRASLASLSQISLT